jgi:hypothetical protein
LFVLRQAESESATSCQRSRCAVRSATIVWAYPHYSPNIERCVAGALVAL